MLHVVETVLPASMDRAINTMVGPSPGVDPPVNYGQLYAIRPNATGIQVLDESGQTSPHGRNIPGWAVVNNRVVLGFEGIGGTHHSTQLAYAKTYRQLLDSKGAVVDLNQPILMIHEGNDPTHLDNVVRILKDDANMKAEEVGAPVSQISMYRTDPAVQTGVNILLQALNRGHDVLIVAHSGGGAESALALNIVLDQYGSHYRELIGQHVKVLSQAGMASTQDYIRAGVKPENVLYVGSKVDAVAEIGSHDVNPLFPWPGLFHVADGLAHATDFNLGPPHDPINILPQNARAVQDFILHHPGPGENGGMILKNSQY